MLAVLLSILKWMLIACVLLCLFLAMGISRLISGPLHGFGQLDEPGSLVVESRELVAGREGELLLRYQAGPQGVPEYWQLWVELPPGWNTRLGCARADRGVKWQHADPDGPVYFGAREIPQGASISCQLGSNSDVLGVGSRFGRVFSFRVSGRDLEPGESFALVFRRTGTDGRVRIPAAGGSGPIRWMVAHPLEPLPHRNRILAEVYRRDPRDYRVRSLDLSLKADSPKHVEVTLPSRAGVGESVRLQVRLLDEHHNLVSDWPAPAQLTGDGLLGNLPENIEPGESGAAEVELTAATAGIARVTVTLPGVGSARSNPLEITEQAPGSRVFWGDAHSHSRFSHDGMGFRPFEYARYASALDFYALTEHSRHVTSDEWEQIAGACAEHHQAGRFVTLLAFEDSAFTPSGHFNLYFGQDRVPLQVPRQLCGVAEAYGDLNPLVVPHHTGKQWRIDMSDYWLKLFNRFFGPHIEWGKFPGVGIHAVEIYSLHGSSELYDPGDPLSYENTDVTLYPDALAVKYCNTGGSRPGPHYARDGWAAGRLMGTLGGSDDHRSQPGRRGGGLTAVEAPELTRQAVLDAIRERRTYATTGDRILLEFSIDSAPMGSVLSARSQARLHARAVGTARIREMTIFYYAWDGQPWEVLKRVQPSGEEAEIELTIHPPGRAVYYVRVDQEGEVNGRSVRAWSSPIWIGKPPG